MSEDKDTKIIDVQKKEVETEKKTEEEEKEEKKDEEIKSEETKEIKEVKEEKKDKDNEEVNNEEGENKVNETKINDDNNDEDDKDRKEYKRLSRSERNKRRRAKIISSSDLENQGGLSVMEEIAASYSIESNEVNIEDSDISKKDIKQKQQINDNDDDDDDEDNELQYQELLNAAKKEDFRDLREADCLYRSGYDSEGRSIVVLIGSNLPGKTVCLDHLLLYMIYTLDSIVENDYVVAYFAAGQSSENRPPFKWIHKVYKIFDRKYKKNLKHLFIVQPTTWLKMSLRFLSALVSKKVWQKVQYLQSFQDIYSYMSPSMLRLPTNFVEKVTTMHPIFGEQLERTVSNPALQRNGIPIVVGDCISYLFDRGLDKVGLLRISGNRALMNEYRLAYDSGKKVDLSQCKDPHTVANLLK